MGRDRSFLIEFVAYVLLSRTLHSLNLNTKNPLVLEPELALYSGLRYWSILLPIPQI